MSATWRKGETGSPIQAGADYSGTALPPSPLSLERVPAILPDLLRRFDSRILSVAAVTHFLAMPILPLSPSRASG